MWPLMWLGSDPRSPGYQPPPSPEDLENAAGDAVAFLDRIAALSHSLHYDGEKDEPAPPTPRAVCLGDGRLQVGEDSFGLESAQRKVIEALLDGPLTKDQLIKKCGVQDAVKILRRLREKSPQLAPFIHLPGARGRGCYRVRIGRKK